MLSANFASCQHHCFSAAFSPYPGDAGSQLLAVACAQYFGIAGNGSVVVFRVLPTGELVPIREFLTQDCAFDVAWSESNINQLTVGAGDGSVSLLDLTTPDTFPIRRYQEHTEEVSGVSWNMVSKQCFISSSWDGLIKLYNPAAPAALQTFDGHRCQVYTVQWHPQTDSIFASGDKKGRLFVWDARSLKPQFALNAASADVLTVDWNKWKEFETCTAGVDGCVRIWDLRNPSHPVHLSAISKLPIKRVRFCPHDSDLVATAGYDMSVNILRTGGEVISQVARFIHHREFVCGLDWSLFRPHMIVSSSWDRHVVSFDWRNPVLPVLPGRPQPGVAATSR